MIVTDLGTQGNRSPCIAMTLSTPKIIHCMIFGVLQMTGCEQYFLSRYFFCGYQIVDNWELTEEQKRLRAMNTFLLALDGDVDFRPEAILKVREVKN